MKSFALSAIPRLIITKNESENTYTVLTWTLMKESSITFKLGEEFDELRQDGVMVKSIVTRNGNVFTQVSKGKASPQPEGDDAEEEKTITVIRTFSPEGINVEATINNVKCTRYYTRVKNDPIPEDGGFD